MKRLVSTIVGLGLLCLFAEAHAVPATVSFTGRLTTSAGPVNGTVALRFALYDRAVDGTERWAETRPAVTASAGLVYADLGALTTLDESILTDDALFLEIRVGNEILQPRLPLQSVPYAIRAEVANTAETLGPIAPGEVVTSVVAGAGITATRAGNAVTLGVNTATLQARVGGTCGPNASIASVSATGTVTCEVDTDTTYSAGAGLALSGTTLGLTACASGQVLKAGPGGTWACAADLDVDTNTTYSAGSGVTLTGTTFATNNAVVARKDAAAGDQIFGTKLAVGVAAPRDLFEVGGAIRVDNIRIFQKAGNNGAASCTEYCLGTQWPGGRGACLTARLATSGAYLTCAVAPGAGNDLSCACVGLNE